MFKTLSRDTCQHGHYPMRLQKPYSTDDSTSVELALSPALPLPLSALPQPCSQEAHVAHGSFTLGSPSISSRQDSNEKEAFEQRQAARKQAAFETETGTVGGSNSVPRGTRRPLVVPTPASQDSSAASADGASQNSGGSSSEAVAEKQDLDVEADDDSDSEDDDDDDMEEFTFPDEAQLRAIKVRRGLASGRGDGGGVAERATGRSQAVDGSSRSSSSREASQMLGDELAEMKAEKARAREERALKGRR